MNAFTNKRRIKMKLERFIKNKKQKRIIIGSIIGLILLIGGITLYKTFALYEENKQFNVLRGQVPAYNYDIRIAVTVDGENVDTIPEKGLYDTKVTCTSGAGSWDYVTWDLTLAGFNSGDKCTIAFTSNPSLNAETLIANSKALRRNTYRGKDITEYFESGKAYEWISAGTFDDIYVGDTMTLNGIQWIVADIDNYLYSGDTGVTKHHITVIPYTTLGSTGMNSMDTTA